MNNQEIAEIFVKSFCNGDIESIAAVLSDDFHLQGRLFQFNTKAAYLDSLQGNLVPDPEAEILALLGDKDKASVFYTYHGNTIGQLFLCASGKIYRTIVVFDSKSTS